MAIYIKELTLGEVIASSLHIYSRNIVPLALCYLLPTFLFIVLAAWAESQFDTTMMVVGISGEFLMSTFAFGAITIAVSDVCIGNKASVVRAYKMVARVMGSYLCVYFLVMLVTLVGFVLLIVPGLIATALLLFALPVVVIERKGGIAAFKRSIALGKGCYLRNFGIFSCSVLALFGLFVLLGFVEGIVFVQLDVEDSFIVKLITGLLVGVVSPLAQIPIVLLYYDMRVRKEFYDQSALSQELFT